jgi:hypothetical protein
MVDLNSEVVFASPICVGRERKAHSRALLTSPHQAGVKGAWHPHEWSAEIPFVVLIFGALAYKSAGYGNLIGLDRDRDMRPCGSPIYLPHKLPPENTSSRCCTATVVYFIPSVDVHQQGERVFGTSILAFLHRERGNKIFGKRPT